jgi:hypothetical protein
MKTLDLRNIDPHELLVLTEDTEVTGFQEFYDGGGKIDANGYALYVNEELVFDGTPIAPDMKSRAECDCVCHKRPGVMHMFPCCDEKLPGPRCSVCGAELKLGDVGWRVPELGKLVCGKHDDEKPSR